MYILFLTLLIISFLGILVILSSKIIEIKTGEASIFSKHSVSADPVLRHKVNHIKAFISKFNKKNYKAVLTRVSHSLFHAFGIAGLFVSKHYKRFINKLNGQRVIKRRGVVSFFLKHMAESIEEKKGESQNDKL